LQLNVLLLLLLLLLLLKMVLFITTEGAAHVVIAQSVRSATFRKWGCRQLALQIGIFTLSKPVQFAVCVLCLSK
jgi:hypothetical protein